MERERKVQIDETSAWLKTIYTPGTPVDDPELFSGRRKLLDELGADLGVPGVHLVLCGGRGVGKSSFWRVLLHGRKFAYHQASADDDFVGIFLSVLTQLRAAFTVTGAKSSDELSASVGVEKVASVGGKSSLEVTATQVAPSNLDLSFVIKGLKDHESEIDAIVIDEFHVVQEPRVHDQISEVVKALGDGGLNVTVVIVGIADSPTQLLRGAQWDDYLGRHLHTRKIPRMTDEEIRGIIDLRESRYLVRFEADVKDAIVETAVHEPAIAHRLALDSSLAWSLRVIAGHFFGLVSWVRAKLGQSSIDVRKAGKDVALEDFCIAVTRHIDRFRNDYTNLADLYDAALASTSRARIQAVLQVLTDTIETSLSAAAVAEQAKISPSELEELVASDAAGLVTVKGDTYALAVRELASFVATKGWCERNPDAMKAVPLQDLAV